MGVCLDINHIMWKYLMMVMLMMIKKRQFYCCYMKRYAWNATKMLLQFKLLEKHVHKKKKKKN